jgi:hypothetical protein
MNVLLLGLVCVVALALVPLGLPGLWVIVLAALVYGPVLGGAGVGWGTVGTLVVVGALAEVVEFVLGARFAQRYGGGRRSAWGAILGGFAGALVGGAGADRRLGDRRLRGRVRRGAGRRVLGGPEPGRRASRRYGRRDRTRRGGRRQARRRDGHGGPGGGDGRGGVRTRRSR